MFINKTFELAPRHFVEGLSSDDFSNYVGFHIPVFSLSEFPHWGKVSKELSLTSAELSERSKAIWDAAEKSYSSSNCSKPHRLSTSSCEWLAEQAFASFSSLESDSIGPRWTPTRRHFTRLQESESVRLDQLDICDFFGERKNVVYPEPLEHEGYSSFQLPRFIAHGSSIVLLEPIHADELSYWAKSARTSPDHILRFPKGNWGPIEAGLHELRHLVQLYPQQTTGPIHKFYCELDADLFARNLIQKTNAGTDFLSARLHARYLDILFAPDEYWFAPVLEAIEHKLPLPRFTEISKAVHTFRGAMINCLGEDETNPPNVISKSPRDGLDLIRAAKKAFAVQDNKLACQIVDRVQVALGYFCPQIHRPRVSGKTSTADRVTRPPQP